MLFYTALTLKSRHVLRTFNQIIRLYFQTHNILPLSIIKKIPCLLPDNNLYCHLAIHKWTSFFHLQNILGFMQDFVSIKKQKYYPTIPAFPQFQSFLIFWFSKRVEWTVKKVGIIFFHLALLFFHLLSRFPSCHSI